MEISRDLLLILHFIAMAGLLGGLLASQSKLNKGVLHSALLALVTGLGLVGTITDLLTVFGLGASPRACVAAIFALSAAS